MTDFQKYALFRGRKYRVLYYEGDGRFRLLAGDDSQRTEHRDLLTFLPSKK